MAAQLGLESSDITHAPARGTEITLPLAPEVAAVKAAFEAAFPAVGMYDTRAHDGMRKLRVYDLHVID